MNFRQFSTKLLSRKPAHDPATSSIKEEKGYDHLVFLVHGIGEHEEKWKNIVPKLEKCHKKVEQYMGTPARVKWIPIEWHSVLHTQTDEHVVKVTPKGMAGPRSFINNTLIDVLFWASPYGQTIITEVGQQFNQLYSQFKKDNPDFTGDVSIFAHSLGSIICYDLLSNQSSVAPISTTSTSTSTASASTYSTSNSTSIPTPIPTSTSTSSTSIVSNNDNTNNNINTNNNTNNTNNNNDNNNNNTVNTNNTSSISSSTSASTTTGGDEGDDSATSGLGDTEQTASSSATSPNISTVNSPRSIATGDKGEGNVAIWRRLTTKDGAAQPPVGPLPGEPHLKYPTIEFDVENFFMVGSPTGIFLTARGVGYPVRLPKCNNLFNIYNPHDPVSYLIEPLVDPGFLSLAPCLVPHIPDTTEALKGAVARGSKSLFSYYKNTTTTTTTTTVTKEVLLPPTSPTSASSSTVTSPAFVATAAAPEVGELITFEEISITETEATQVVDPLSLNELTLSPRLEAATPDKAMNPPPQPQPAMEEKQSGNGNGANSGEKSNVFFERVRFDYRMQPSGIVENLSEYAALINAHKCYWDSKDVMLFVLQQLL